MSGQDLQLGNGALVVMGVYLLAMLGIGWLGRVNRKEESLRDFYLGGSSFGVGVLFLTLFATQYSGNTLLGFAGRSYQQGGTYIVSVTFMILVITVMMTFAPRLFRLARRFGYITPVDYVFHRFGSDKLRVLSVILLCWGLGNYILEQLVAMGHAVEGISSGRISFMTGVLTLVVVMLVYESLGGMRSVAWTDVIQGTLLLVGCTCILYILLTSKGGIPAATEAIQRTEPQKLQVPGGHGIRVWVSNLVLLGLGVAIYPHAIQRIFAARSLPTLRKSLAGMVFMPLGTTFLAFLIGFIALSRFPGLSQLDSDKATVLVLSDIIGQSAFTYWLVVIVFSAVVAAIMSTADSALLSMGSMFTKDIYKPYIRPDASPKHLLKVGKLFGWTVMAVLILSAYISLKTESSIWLLIRLKLEFMVQLSPIFILGLFWRRLREGPVFAGMMLGTLVTLVIWGGVMFDLWQDRSPLGFSAGLWGLALNYGACVAGTLMSRAPTPSEASVGAS
ncbi:MAG: sodium:solute symporter family protein [Acidobacteriota bacterium]|nr:sodium:solute symporter family protein [Acidobacteriota bacterium]